MSVPINHEIEHEGEVYVLVDSALLRKFNPQLNPCCLCALRDPCGSFDCITDGPEVGVYVRKLGGGVT